MAQKTYSALLVTLLCGTLSVAAQAQEVSRVKTRVNAADGTPELLSFRAERAYATGQADQLFREQLGLGQDDQLRARAADADALGFRHEKFQQYYKGVKVEHGVYTLHSRQGRIETATGRFERLGRLEVTPSLSETQALSRALAFVGAKAYMWQDAGEEAELKRSAGSAAATYQPKGELVIVRNERGTRTAVGQPVLAYKFNVYAQEPVSRAYIYVDARSGEVVYKDDIIKHVGATGSFATRYSGTRALATETATGGYRLREYTRGLGIETYNMKKGTQYNRAVDFVDADNNWVEYNNAAFDNAAGDAHFGAEATYDYWQAVHGRNSYDNAGAKIKSYVHYSRSYENAYWNGSVMTYGDGATTFSPLTSLDVCGHEIGHAVCERTANLTYSGESGAMNEGLSDIWGACVEARAVAQYGLTGKDTWAIGEEIKKAGGALRSMSNPNLYNQPDTYKGSKWYVGTNDNGGVHTNSGVLNFWFYLLSVGGSGTNDLGNAYSVGALGLDAAAKITFRMESVYMVASSTYPQARTFAIQAATDLYGAGSAQVTAVTNAWYAVGVGAATTAAVATSPSPAINAGIAGLSGTLEAAGFSVFPVPASSELRLQLPGNAAVRSAKVLDLRGATVQAARYAGDGRLDVSQLAQGTYLVQCSDGTTTFRQRFVKQ